jgi:protein-S-isoprenylcysteine O-methyltransferase Ste14
MLLKDRLARQGNVLFRWRSYLPLMLIPLMLVGLPQSGTLERVFGSAAETAWDGFAALLACLGVVGRVATVGFVPAGTSGRNVHGQRADALNTTGLYSVVRNPLYLGNLTILTAFALETMVWWIAPLAAVAGLLYYERIVYAEEGFLAEKYGRAYSDWAAVTPAFVPDFSRWRRPALPFCWRTALRREYHGLLVVVGGLTAIEVLTDIIGEGETPMQWAAHEGGWVWFFAIGMLLYASLRTIRKRTSWLAAPER